MEVLPLLLMGIGTGWVFALLTRWTALLRWPGIALIIFALFDEPDILSIYHPLFWPGLGYVLGIAQYYYSNRKNAGSGIQGGFRQKLKRFVIAPFRYVFITIPVFLIRLGFWLKNTIPLLVTPRGWGVLFRGLRSWLYHLLPYQIRAEWERHSNAVPQQKPKSKTRKRTAPEEPRSASDNFWHQERSRTRESKSRHAGNKQEEPQKTASSTPPPPPKESPPPKKKARKTKAAEAPKNTSQTSSKPDVMPGNPAYPEHHRSEFKSVGWPFDPLEKSVIEGKSAYSILGLTSSASPEEIKRVHRKLARTYLPFTDPYNPIPVQKHANIFMATINGAKDQIGKWQNLHFASGEDFSHCRLPVNGNLRGINFLESGFDSFHHKIIFSFLPKFPIWGKEDIHPLFRIFGEIELCVHISDSRVLQQLPSSSRILGDCLRWLRRQLFPFIVAIVHGKVG